MISEVSQAESNDPTVQCTEADPLEFTGARVPAVRLTMVPVYPKVRMEARRRESHTFRAAHPACLLCAPGAMSQVYQRVK